MALGFVNYNVSNPSLGGYATGPFVGSGLYATTASSGRSSRSSGGNGISIGGLDNNMIKLLYEKGLFSDVTKFLTDALQAIELAYDPETDSYNYSAYKVLIPALSLIRENAETYKEVRDKLIAEDRLGDYVVSANGELLVSYLDENGDVLKDWLTVNLILQLDPNSYKIFTNGALASTRANSIEAAFNLDIVSTLSKVVNIQDVAKYLKEILPKIGAYTLSTDVSETSSVTQPVAESAQALMQMVKEGLSSLQLTTTSEKQAALALNYMYGMLPKNMKAVLDLLAFDLGLNAHSLIASLVGAGLSGESKVGLKINNLDAKKAGRLSQVEALKMPAIVQWLMGHGERLPIAFLLGTSAALAGVANVFSMQDGNNKNLGIVSMDKMSTAEGAGAFDWQHVTLAGLDIKSVKLHDIIADTTAIYRVELPIDMKEFLKTGVVKPDFAMLPRIEIAENKIREQHAEGDPKKINKIYQDLELPLKYTEDGKSLTSLYKYFGAVNTYFNDKVFGKGGEYKVLQRYLKEYTDKDDVEDLIRMIKSTRRDGEDYDYTYGSLSRLLHYNDHFFQGVAFIPVRNNVFNAYQGSGVVPTISLVESVLSPAQERQDNPFTIFLFEE